MRIKPYPIVDPKIRFNKKYFIDAKGCWMWQGAISENGYGKFSIRGKDIYAHRFSYETFKGPIQEGYVIDHMCLVKSCCNPEHLDVTIQAENVYRGINRQKLKTRCKHGHLFSEENTIRYNGEWRRCRTCEILRSRRRIGIFGVDTFDRLPNRRPSFCKKGHQLIDGNVYKTKDGRRRCLICIRLCNKRYKEKKKSKII